MHSFNHICKIRIDDFPAKWVSKIHLFDPELPDFPLYYIHVVDEACGRIFGVPVYANYEGSPHESRGPLEVTVLSNLPLEAGSDEYKIFAKELRNRFGLEKEITLETLHNCCNGNENYKKFVDLIFPRLKTYYGDSLPFGRFYEHIYGIIRFISAWNTTGGRKQEMIMLSNVLERIGERAQNNTALLPSITFFLLPVLNEVRTHSYSEFPNFHRLEAAVKDFGDLHLTQVVRCGSFKLHALNRRKEVPGGKGNAPEKWLSLLKSPGISKETLDLLTGIREDFNRMPQRTFIFVSILYNLFKGVDFGSLSNNDYTKLFQERPRGTYPKVIACFVQQAYDNPDVIPVDTWVDTFLGTVLDMDEENYTTALIDPGKFERFIWLAVQLRKNNRPLFNDVLFCVKTGVYLSKNIINRGPNPVSCSLCNFRADCPTAKKKLGNGNRMHVIMLNDPRLISGRSGNLLLRKNDELKSISDRSLSNQISSSKFLITTDESGKPREVYVKAGQRTRNSAGSPVDVWDAIDDMSGLTAVRIIERGSHPANLLLA